MQAIEGLERIDVPVALVWGRQDLATPLAVAEAAAARYGWPLHVIEDCADDPPIERPEAFVRALAAEELRERVGRHAPAARRRRLRRRDRAVERMIAKTPGAGRAGERDGRRRRRASAFARDTASRSRCAAAATTSPAPRSPTAA